MEFLPSTPTKLWVRVLKMKYCRGTDIENLRMKGQGSNTRRGIMDNFHLTKEGLEHAIGDGQRTKFWTHKWIDGKELISQALAAKRSPRGPTTPSDI